jgi:hypothetical protein
MIYDLVCDQFFYWKEQWHCADGKFRFLQLVNSILLPACPLYNVISRSLEHSIVCAYWPFLTGSFATVNWLSVLLWCSFGVCQQGNTQLGCLKIVLVKQERVVILHHFLVNTVIPCPTWGFRGSDIGMLDTATHTLFIGKTGFEWLIDWLIDWLITCGFGALQPRCT